MPAELKTKYVFSLAINVAAPISAGEIGHGTRRVVPIVGGRVFGGLSGTILPFGADFQILRPDGMAELEAKYCFMLDDGAVVYIENIGIRVGPRELTDRLARGEAVDPALIYFRSIPRFETGADNHRWLMQHIFIGVGARHPDRVEIDVHQLL